MQVLALAVISCARQTEPPPAHPEAAPATAEAEPPPATRTEADVGPYMADHFALATFARDAVIDGDIEVLRAPLRGLADYDYNAVATGPWLPWIARLQQAARLTAEASDLDRAAAGVAAMASVCGECHRDRHSGPEFVVPSSAGEAPAHDTLTERMFRHMWGADMLWIGITGPSDEAWRLGADALARAPAAPPTEVEQLPRAFVVALEDLRELGQRAQVATSVGERADLYGLMLATCAGCHAHGASYPF